MIKVLFVCLGNICRSPMAEFLLKDMVRKKNWDNMFLIESAGTSNEEEGNPVHYGTRRKLSELGIMVNGKYARKLTKADYEKYDYILAMEERNLRDSIKIFEGNKKNKVYRLLDFSKNPRDISDPWYTGDFDKTYDDIIEGLDGFIKYLKDNYKTFKL